MGKMTTCKSCKNEISTSAKVCPNCGIKNKKPFYKKWWIWAIAVVIVIGFSGNGNDNGKSQVTNTNNANNAQVTENAPKVTETVKPENNVPTEYKSALKKAKLYSETMNMSKIGIYEQLTSEYGEKFTKEAAQYAVDNVNADWKANALKKAELYQKEMSMSPSSIRDQLISEYGEKFTKEEAEYAIQNLK